MGEKIIKDTKKFSDFVNIKRKTTYFHVRKGAVSSSPQEIYDLNAETILTSLIGDIFLPQEKISRATHELNVNNNFGSDLISTYFFA